MNLFKKKKEEKYSKYYPKQWHFATIIMSNIAFASYVGYEVYKIVNAYNLNSSIDAKNLVITSALYIMIGVAIIFPVNIINYLADYFKKRELQIVLIFIELFLMMAMMLKLLFAIL